MKTNTNNKKISSEEMLLDHLALKKELERQRGFKQKGFSLKDKPLLCDVHKMEAIILCISDTDELINLIVLYSELWNRWSSEEADRIYGGMSHFIYRRIHALLEKKGLFLSNDISELLISQYKFRTEISGKSNKTNDLITKRIKELVGLLPTNKEELDKLISLFEEYLKFFLENNINSNCTKIMNMFMNSIHKMIINLLPSISKEGSYLIDLINKLGNLRNKLYSLKLYFFRDKSSETVKLIEESLIILIKKINIKNYKDFDWFVDLLYKRKNVDFIYVYYGSDGSDILEEKFAELYSKVGFLEELKEKEETKKETAPERLNPYILSPFGRTLVWAAILSIWGFLIYKIFF